MKGQSSIKDWPSVVDLRECMDRPDPQWEAWRNSVPDKHWARFDLSAVRLGYELGKVVASQESYDE